MISLPSTFPAMRVTENEAGFRRSITQMSFSELPHGELLIKVAASSLNYKDALSAAGHKGITRRYPHTPGIDAAGIVVASEDSAFSVGDPVIVTSYDLGMNTPGGFGAYIRVPAAWALPLPAGMSLEESMIIGTAGFTAGIALHKLQTNGLRPDKGPVVVTGSSGGVGTMAVSMLAHLGYHVVASTGTPAAEALLRKLGAAEIISRADVEDDSGRPLLKSRWAAGIDTVGGNTLITLLKACQREGSIAVCGLVGSANLDATVYPFILNGANLLGVDSATYPMDSRREIWHRLAGEWRSQYWEELATFIELSELDQYLAAMLQGKTVGRIVLRHAV